MELAATKGDDCDEFRIACQLQSEGRLFEKFTAKKRAELAEALLQARFTYLMGDEVEAARDLPEIQAARDFTMEELEQLEALHDDSTWQGPEYQQILPTLRMQGTQHQQSLFVSDETQSVNSTQKKQKQN